MMQCLSVQSPSPAQSAVPNAHVYDPPYFEGDSEDATSSTIVLASPAANLRLEFGVVVESTSFRHMWSLTHPLEGVFSPAAYCPGEDDMLANILGPNQERVGEVLRRAVHSKARKPPGYSTADLISEYFEQSEETARLCVGLFRSLYRARKLYDPLSALLNDLTHHPLSPDQCDRAYDEFLRFHSLHNPFAGPGSHSFNQVSSFFSQLKKRADDQKSAFKIRSTIRCTGILCTPYIPLKFIRKVLAQDSQLLAASDGAFKLKHQIDSLKSVVDALHSAIEGDKRLIKFGIDGGRDRHTIWEVLDLLRKNLAILSNRLNDLEDQICLSSTAVRETRDKLFQEISKQEGGFELDWVRPFQRTK